MDNETKVSTIKGLLGSEYSTLSDGEILDLIYDIIFEEEYDSNVHNSD